MQLFREQFRQISLIFDEPSKIIQIVDQFSNPSAILHVSDEKLPCNITQILPNQTNQYLGQELECIIFDARSNFNVNAFVAISGCLFGGGKMVMHLPRSLGDKAGNLLHNYDVSEISPTLNRLIKNLMLTIKHSTVNKRLTNSHDNDFEALQQNVINKIKRCALGHAKRPLVITANRGRGKSAALGISAAELIFHNNKTILVTAPRKDNVKIFYQHFNSKLTELNSLQNKKESSIQQLKKMIFFVAPDELIDSKPDADFVIVEEAGAIPIQMLETLINQYNRLVFSTTVGGYEGNGQGFEIRFKAYLNDYFPQWRATSLTHPIRWPNNDPLEWAINKAFLLSFDKTYAPLKQNTNLDDICYSQVKQTDLKKNEKLLEQIYQLLVTAHYQTRPSDLERLLNDKSVLIFTATLNQAVMATALIAIEGSLSEKACQEIEQGKKRISGNLLPQSLMAYQGEVKAGTLKFWRVMRIATHPHKQRKGIGSELLSFITSEAEKNVVDIIGASFSLNVQLSSFWYQHGFKCSRIALRKDSSTGSYPGEFMKLIQGCDQQALETFNHSVNKFNRSFLYSISSSYKRVKTDIIVSLINGQSEALMLREQHDMSEIYRYLNNARSYEMVEWDIFIFIKYALLNPKIREKLSKQDIAVLIAKSFQKKNWTLLSKEFGFDGKKKSKNHFREIISKLNSFDSA